MIIKKISVDKIKPAAYNPRVDLQPGDAEYEKIKKSIEEFDLVEPLVWNEATGNLVGGHQRLKVLREKGLKEVEVSVVNITSLRREMALNSALNKAQGDWDIDKLGDFFKEYEKQSEIDGLEVPDYDLTGFSENEVTEILDGLVTTEPDESEDIPEPPKTPKTKPGDLYILGNSRLLCGDSTNNDDILTLMDGKKANLVITSPPYWVGKDYEKEKSENEIDDFIKKSCDSINTLMDPNNSRIVINSGTGMSTRIGEKDSRVILLIDKWINNLQPHDWILRHIRMWIKSGGGVGSPISPKSDVVYAGSEYILTFYKRKSKNRGMNKVGEGWAQQSNWSDIKGDKQENKAGFPTELPLRNIKLYSLENEIVVDIFGGNGTTLIASQQLNRPCYMMELDPSYCDVIVQRWENYSGKKADLHRDEKTTLF